MSILPQPYEQKHSWLHLSTEHFADIFVCVGNRISPKIKRYGRSNINETFNERPTLNTISSIFHFYVCLILSIFCIFIFALPSYVVGFISLFSLYLFLLHSLIFFSCFAVGMRLGCKKQHKKTANQTKTILKLNKTNTQKKRNPVKCTHSAHLFGASNTTPPPLRVIIYKYSRILLAFSVCVCVHFHDYGK